MNLYKYFGFPESVSTGFVLVSLVASLAPYIKGRLGSWDIPEMTTTLRSRLRWIGPILLAISLCAYYPWHQKPPGPLVVDTSLLEESLRKHTSRLHENPAKFKELEDYYREANAQCINAIAKLKSSERGAVYLMGAAGSGKSFLLRTLEKDVAKRLELSKLVPTITGYELQPDLTSISGDVISSLPHLNVSGESCLKIICEGSESPHSTVIVVDDLDEVHEKLAEELLKSIEAQITNPNPKYPRRFVVCGRPESFSGWLADDKRIPSKDVSIFEMNYPRFESFADAEIPIRDYLKFKGKQEVEINFAITQFRTLAREYPFIVTTLQNLSSSNYLAEILIQDKDLSHDKILDRLFDSLLERNHDSHRRPTERTAPYVTNIVNVAAKYADKVESDGFFAVKFSDEIDSKFRVRDLLDRSGFVYLNPADFKSRRYRFEPSWMHLYLVSEHNKRIAINWKPHACRSISGAWIIIGSLAATIVVGLIILVRRKKTLGGISVD